MMQALATPQKVTLRCTGKTKAGRPCTYIHGAGEILSFEHQCPKCGTWMTYSQPRVQSF